MNTWVTYEQKLVEELEPLSFHYYSICGVIKGLALYTVPAYIQGKTFVEAIKVINIMTLLHDKKTSTHNNILTNYRKKNRPTKDKMFRFK